MRENYWNILVAAGLLIPSSAAFAADKEILTDNDKSVEMAISIYNNNLGFVKDVREVNLNKGSNSVAFVGVANQIKPETAMLSADGVEVVEQDYNYNLMTPVNIINESVGQTVKTALYNEQTGQTTYDSAKIIDSNYGNPILQFSYGIETSFPGRIIFEKLPENLRAKPTLVVKMNSQNVGAKKLELAYLTGGISWKADYVAEIKAKDALTLNGWITLNNESGIDYNNATVQLIAGNVNQVSPEVLPRPMMFAARKAMPENAMMMDSMAAGAVSNEAFADYYLYTLPVKTTIKDKQSKQVSLFVKDNVKFSKEYKLVSPLYVGVNMSGREFEKANPEVMFKINNAKEGGLGLPMPSGIVRFYEEDSKQNMQFIGESQVPQLAEGEKTELLLGKSFDISAKGKVANVNKISKDIYEAEIEVTFKNAKAEEVTVNFEQNLNDTWQMLSESVKSEKKSSGVAKWSVKVPAKGETVLKFKVRITRI